jgi:predicted regulator of Ras-like GTPase activity (Roadblock/LC7/MglB family)
MTLSANGQVSAPAEAPPARGRNFRQLLRELVGLEHVRGGLIVAPDGLVIAAELPREVPIDALSALAATLGRELELRGPRLRRGTFLMAHFAAGDGTVFLGGTPVGFIVLLGGAEVDRDAVRQSLRSAMDSVRQAWSR